MELAVVAGESDHPAAVLVADSGAYDAYLKGRESIHDRTKDALQEAIGHLERSISLDNSFAPAHAQLAIATLLYHGYGYEEGRRVAALHLDRAQELDPDLAEGYAGQALYSLHDDPESAVIHAQKALAVNPSYIDAMHWLSIALHAVGRVEESEALLEREIVIDPLSIVARRTYAIDLLGRGRIDEAHEIADRIVAQNPSAGYSLHARISFWGEGDLVNSVAWGLRASRNNFFAWAALGNVGEYDEALRMAGIGSYWLYGTRGQWDEAVSASKVGGSLLPIAAQRQHSLYARWLLYEFNNPMTVGFLRRQGVMHRSHFVTKLIEQFLSAARIRLCIARHWGTIRRSAVSAVACNTHGSAIRCCHDWTFARKSVAGKG